MLGRRGALFAQYFIAKVTQLDQYVLLLGSTVISGPFATAAEAVNREGCAARGLGVLMLGRYRRDASSKLKVGNMTMRSGIPKTPRSPRTAMAAVAATGHGFNSADW